jgi:hypothetical protein
MKGVYVLLTGEISVQRVNTISSVDSAVQNLSRINKPASGWSAIAEQGAKLWRVSSARDVKT